eukprot:9959133-Alexandrium_andersonii.AAC.1
MSPATPTRAWGSGFAPARRSEWRAQSSPVATQGEVDRVAVDPEGWANYRPAKRDLGVCASIPAGV